MASITPLAIETQREINERMRLILVDWMTDVSQHFMQNGRTLHLAISYLDRYLSVSRHLPRSKF